MSIVTRKAFGIAILGQYPIGQSCARPHDRDTAYWSGLCPAGVTDKGLMHRPRQYTSGASTEESRMSWATVKRPTRETRLTLMMGGSFLSMAVGKVGNCMFTGVACLRNPHHAVRAPCLSSKIALADTYNTSWDSRCYSKLLWSKTVAIWGRSVVARKWAHFKANEIEAKQSRSQFKRRASRHTMTLAEPL